MCGWPGRLAEACLLWVKSVGKNAGLSKQSSTGREHKVAVVGRTSTTDFCHISSEIEGVTSTAGVDMGSSVTVAWPEVVPAGLELESTTAHPLTVKLLVCLKECWDSSSHCQCPVCKEEYSKTPKLRVNTFISGLAAQFKKSVQVKSSRAPEKPAKPQKSTEKEKADSVEVFRALLRCIERSQAELLEVMEEKQKAAERQAEEFIKELEQEITELKRRDTELEQLSHTEDHLHLLQVYPSLCSPPHTKNWTEVRINTHLRVETLRRALSQLQEKLTKNMEKVPEIMDVTLDPDSAHPKLILSDDGKQVRHGDKRQNLPDKPERFDCCVNVLGKEGFSSGRFYYEVQVSGKTDWDVGVTTESSNRKGEIKLRPEDGYWTVWLRNETEYEALDSPSVPLSLKQAPQKVGVFVDYEEGLVSFYDVESRSHIYSFTGQSFTEKLYPYFSPSLNEGVKRAPAVIQLVNFCHLADKTCKLGRGGGGRGLVTSLGRSESKAGLFDELSSFQRDLQTFSEELSAADLPHAVSVSPLSVMASSSSLLSEDQLQCSICLDVFTDPVSTPCGHNFCRVCLKKCWDSSSRCKCPVCMEEFSKRPELRVNTFISGLAAQFKKSVQVKSSRSPEKRPSKPTKVLCNYCTDEQLEAVKSCLDCGVSYWEESRRKKTQLQRTQAAVHQMIQNRRRKIEEIKRSVELHKKSTEKEKADSMEVFRSLLRCIERSQAELLEVMEEKQKAAERQAEEFIKELEQEITELKRRDTELEQLSHTENHLHLLQVYPSLCSPPHTKNWTEVRINTHLRAEALRKTMSQLQHALNKEMEMFPEIKFKRIQEYAVDVTLDPVSAHPKLILSDDGKQVTCGDIKQNLPDTPERFDHCVDVLGKEGFSSGRFYYEIQVSRKTKWDLGVTTESSNRKGEITLSPKNGYWTLFLRNETEYKALGTPSVPLSLKQAPQKVGVFVDYDEGLVSFYDVEARSHIYSFTGQSFFEKLYPFFSPCTNYDGKNSAPLIILPVKHGNRGSFTLIHPLC
ncbi:hypothetical protein MHYP_G00015580 [Metynnis hypsauchen]